MSSRLSGKKNIFIIVVLFFTCLACYFFNNPVQMSPIWTAPFFSAATNFEMGKGFRISESDCWHFKYMPASDREYYHFQESDSLSNYNHNPIGYVYFIIVAKKIFFWQSDIQAVESLQILIHILISLVLLWSARSWAEMWLYTLLYAVNPLIIYFVTFPFYYALQAIPTIFAVGYLINKKLKYQYGSFFIAVIMAFVFLSRPTTLFVCLFVLLFFFLKEKRVYSISAVLLFIATILVFNTSTKKNPWHTFYIGIGGYPNPYMSGLTDNNGYLLYQTKTGKTLNMGFGGSYYNDTVATQYQEISRSEFIRIAKESPFMLIKNAALNFFESFSGGYFIDLPLWVNYVSAIVGLLLLGWMLYRKYYWWAVLIAVCSLSFSPYFPPIQAYMFGSYVAIVCVIVQLLVQTELGKRIYQKTIIQNTAD
ncbi:hypothetical protein QNI19_31300 [Cytophagaceae bacterium DM2B3-1]|uniref:Glycosyltransferase RgtA/B/C/D-like domain-containing protein n=2 Tax=Xanthocytophaga flava TaxID=3048013 RepID=A0ABT7CX06_9BACT|nr:hypothetical protein [Xanthocytophaga flavus]